LPGGNIYATISGVIHEFEFDGYRTIPERKHFVLIKQPAEGLEEDCQELLRVYR
jgi:hypothetical protein